MEQQEYVYQEFPKWVRGVDGNGAEVSIIVQDAAEEAEQVERLAVLDAAKKKVGGSRKGAKADAPAEEAEQVEGAGA